MTMIKGQDLLRAKINELIRGKHLFTFHLILCFTNDRTIKSRKRKMSGYRYYHVFLFVWIYVVIFSFLSATTTTSVLVEGLEDFRLLNLLSSSFRTNPRKSKPMNSNKKSFIRSSNRSSSSSSSADGIKSRRSKSCCGGDNDSNNDDITDVEERFFEQRLDHFSSPSLHFEQRYFYSSRFLSDSYNNSTSSNATTTTFAFLCVGGEGPALDRSVLVDSVHCSGDMIELAKILHENFDANVHLFALEHRYYGSSYPVFMDEHTNKTISPITNENLKYLSSRQALGDLAHFVSSVTITNTNKDVALIPKNDGSSSSSHSSTLQLPSSTTWVTFGGSYPGMLSAWARFKYPHLIFASVSNSAPVQAKMDMFEYNDLVAFDLQYEKIGGSKTCLDVIQQGHNQLIQGLLSEDDSLYKKIINQFQICDPSSLLDVQNIQMFLGDGVIDVGAQGNDPHCDSTPLCNIEQLCFAIEHELTTNQPNNNNNTGTTTAWEILANISRQQRHQQQVGRRNKKIWGDDETGEYGDDCLDINWNETLRYLSDTSNPNLQKEGIRSWLYQTCTEFGFYQTCEPDSRCPYGKGFHPLSVDLDICGYAFGIPPQEVEEAISQTIEYYGGRPLKGASRILSVNGNVDPWSTLARHNNTNEEHAEVLLPVYNAMGASHHFWTHPVKQTDDLEITEARDFIYSTVLEWLGYNYSRNDHTSNHNNNLLPLRTV